MVAVPSVGVVMAMVDGADVVLLSGPPLDTGGQTKNRQSGRLAAGVLLRVLRDYPIMFTFSPVPPCGWL